MDDEQPIPRQRAWTDALAAVAEDLAGEFRLQPLLERILRSAVELLGCRSGSLCLIDAAAHNYLKQIDLDEGCQTGMVFPLEEGCTGAVARAGRTVIFERYADVPDAELPRTESLKLVIDRMLPYWHSDITASLREGHTVLVTAHGNSLRALVKHLDGISDDAIAELNIPTGIPLVYELDDEFRPVGESRYLDPEAAAAGAAAVAAQGKK